MEAFNKVWDAIRKKENYIPRNYQTVGGMWTVDTWRYDNIIIQLMDEGYTQRILTTDLDVFQNCRNELTFMKGDKTILERIAGEV